MSYSVIIPTYNRRNLIINSINSAIEFFSQGAAQFEIVIIDDCSNDETAGLIKQTYKKELERGIIRYYFLEKNIGVTGAKNFGAREAYNEFFVFLDSDDTLTGNLEELLQASDKIKQFGIGFFRSVSALSGKLVGAYFVENKVLDAGSYRKIDPFPECLPVVHKAVFDSLEYPAQLRGFEGLLYVSHLFSGKKIFLSNCVLRKYTVSGVDSISSSKNSKKRLIEMRNGHMELVYLSLKHGEIMFLFRHLLRFVFYGVKCFF